jgi:hypothetical protein
MLNPLKYKFQPAILHGASYDFKEVTMVEKCDHKFKKVLEKKVINLEEVPAAYCATLTKTTYQMLYECKDCGEKWTETKVDTKFD